MLCTLVRNDYICHQHRTAQSYMASKVLFICSGNYYRSRFAEILFNYLATDIQLDWRAFSRGFKPGPHNPGKISPFTLEALDERAIPPGEIAEPTQISEADLENAILSIALKEAEHRPFMEKDFPAWADRITYWHIDDVDYATPQEALPQIEQLVRELVDRLRNQIA